MPHARCTNVHDTRAAMTFDLSSPQAEATVQPGTPQARPQVPSPRKDGRHANRSHGGHVITHPAADRDGLVAQLAQERHVALELQRAILPLHDKPFDLPGLRVAMRYLPASKASRVGGDWYITAQMPSGDVLIAI